MPVTRPLFSAPACNIQFFFPFFRPPPGKNRRRHGQQPFYLYKKLAAAGSRVFIGIKKLPAGGGRLSTRIKSLPPWAAGFLQV